MVRLTTILAILILLTGCTKYDYEIIDPPDLSGRIGFDDDMVVSTAAAEYRFRAAGDRLVVRIYNNDATVLRLDGTKSTVVSPDGQSRPVIGQAIAPGSFGKLLLPPPRPTIDAYGSGLHYGFYYSTGFYDDWPGYHHDHYHDRGDRYRHGPYRPHRRHRSALGDSGWSGSSNSIYDESNPSFWDWNGETQISLSLFFDREGKLFEDRFVIQRHKIK